MVVKSTCYKCYKCNNIILENGVVAINCSCGGYYSAISTQEVLYIILKKYEELNNKIEELHERIYGRDVQLGQQDGDSGSSHTLPEGQWYYTSER